jgi:hypothetical protein
MVRTSTPPSLRYLLLTCQVQRPVGQEGWNNTRRSFGRSRRVALFPCLQAILLFFLRRQSCFHSTLSLHILHPTTSQPFFNFPTLQPFNSSTFQLFSSLYITLQPKQRWRHQAPHLHLTSNLSVVSEPPQTRRGPLTKRPGADTILADEQIKVRRSIPLLTSYSSILPQAAILFPLHSFPPHSPSYNLSTFLQLSNSSTLQLFNFPTLFLPLHNSST